LKLKPNKNYANLGGSSRLLTSSARVFNALSLLIIFLLTLMDTQNPMQARQADTLVEGSAHSLGRRLRLVAKSQVKLWKALLFAMFIAGFASALTLAVSSTYFEDKLSTSEAAGATCVSVEAEKGQLTAPMVTWHDSGASGGEFVFVWVPNASGAGSGANDNKGSAYYAVKIPKAGTYKLWGRVFAASGNDNSFYVAVSNVGGAGDKVEWGLTSRNKWAWESVEDVNKKKVSYALKAQTYTIMIAGREDGTKIDKLVFQLAKDGTPKGMGPDCGSGATLYPDLTVDTPVATVNREANHVTTVGFTGTVHNIGNAPARNFQNRFYIQWDRREFNSRERIDESLVTDSISELAPGASKELRTRWYGTLQYGTHAVQFCANVNPASDGDEGGKATEESNCKSTAFTVRGEGVTLGDVNGDGSISGSDVVLLTQYLAGTQQLTADQLLAADVTQNNAVTRKDADTISAYLAFNISRFAKFGDVNFDYQITGADSVLLAQFVSGAKTPNKDQRYYGNVDGDPPLMQDDVDLMNRYLAFLISEFPVDPASQ
jgi:hypothetical protein